MNWHIGSFPELEHLSDSERKELLRQQVGLRVRLRMVVLVLAVGLLAGFCGGIVTINLLPDALTALIVFLVSFGVGAVLEYQILLIRIRGQLIMYLERTAKKQRLPMCLCCGYSLEGLPGDVCPECGKTITAPRPSQPNR